MIRDVFGGVMAYRFFLRKVEVIILRKIRSVLAMALATVMSMTVAVPTFAAEVASDAEQNEVITTEAAADAGVMPLGTDYYTVGNPGERYVRVFNRASAYSGPITITVQNFNPILYQVDIMTDDKNGLVYAKDNWMGGGSKAVYNPNTYGGPIVAIWLRIKPRAQLITSDKAFTVEVSW